MKRYALVLLLSALLGPAFASAGDAEKKEWIPLFNGKNLNGWIPKITGYEAGVNFGNTFRVENGVLKVAYDQYDTFRNRFGHLFYKTPFSHYAIWESPGTDHEWQTCRRDLNDFAPRLFR